MADFPTYEIEKAAADSGFPVVCGIDEAGRGPLAGPVFAAAVVLPINCEIPGLNDSKKLTEKKREALFDVIMEKAVAYGIGIVNARQLFGIGAVIRFHTSVFTTASPNSTCVDGISTLAFSDSSG